MIAYNQHPLKIIPGKNRTINIFSIGNDQDSNVDLDVLDSFAQEWNKFHDFSDTEIDKLGGMYFDILNDTNINKESYCIDIGCGTGRWTKYLLPKIGFMEAVDPSNAIFSADVLLGDAKKVRLSQAATDNLPFDDESFDFGMSIGVLHHIPNTRQAL